MPNLVKRSDLIPFVRGIGDTVGKIQNIHRLQARRTRASRFMMLPLREFGLPEERPLWRGARGSRKRENRLGAAPLLSMAHRSPAGNTRSSCMTAVSRK